MPFPSLIFLFVFFPVSLLLYFILPFKRWRDGILLITSLFFFAWGDPVNLILLIAVNLFNWLHAIIDCTPIFKYLGKNPPARFFQDFAIPGLAIFSIALI